MAWFMKFVYPLLPSTVRIVVVGRVCNFLEEKDNVTLIPYGEDLDEIYSKSKLVFCPLRGGSGLKVKVVEALAYGKPVITTSYGLSGILQKCDNGCFLADSKEEFVRGARLLLNNANEYRKFKQRAEEFFMQHFTTEICRKRLDSVFLRA